MCIEFTLNFFHKLKKIYSCILREYKPVIINGNLIKNNIMKYLPLNPEIFIQNRKRFIAKMDKNSIAIFNSNDEMPTNGDALYPFVQNSDLFWLSGIEQEDTMVILFPDNPDPKYREVLVLVRPNELKEKWDGHCCVQMKRKYFRDKNNCLVRCTGWFFATMDTSGRYYLFKYQ